MHVKLHFVLEFLQSTKYREGVSYSNIFLAEPLSYCPLAPTSALILEVVEPKYTGQNSCSVVN
jgi:hypothetical protein